MKSTVLLICLSANVGLLATAESRSDEKDNDSAPSKPDATGKFIGKEAGQVRDDNGLKMKLVWCPPGIVTMENAKIGTEPVASNDDEPNENKVDPIGEPSAKPRLARKFTPVKVFLSQGYWLGKYEVTQSEWRQLMKTEPWKDQKLIKEGDDFPATYVSWDDAMKFCQNLTEDERTAGRLPDDWHYTLPTEAQWERACRARTETRFSFGDDELELGEYAWFVDNTRKVREGFAHRVGQRKANPWGLFDMHGNVWEWCRDFYAEKLPGGNDPEVKTGDSIRVDRGGGWMRDAAYCRSAYRGWTWPDARLPDIGLRVALSVVRSDEANPRTRSEDSPADLALRRSEAERFFDLADKNKDGKVTADEVEKTALVRIKFKKVKPVFPLGRDEFVDLYIQAGRN